MRCVFGLRNVLGGLRSFWFIWVTLKFENTTADRFCYLTIEDKSGQ